MRPTGGVAYAPHPRQPVGEHGIGESEMNHAIRTLRSTMHGFAMLEASLGFQWDADPDESFEWMVGFIDRGLRGSH
jgi:hypothetical protein